MRIKLHKIRYENFKCFKALDFKPEGNNARASAGNGKGKTTLKDGLFWLHYDKDSTGRKKFGYRPKDTNSKSPTYGKVINGLTVAVEDELLIDGVPHTFRREEKERIVKEQVVGYTSLYWIDGVPKKEREYKEYFENICPEDKFIMLTDLDFFNNDKKNNWNQRRKTLEDMSGNLPEPSGFEDVTDTLNGRKIEDVKKILKEQKKAYKTERDEINPRIDELQKGPADYVQNVGDSEIELRAKRDEYVEKVDALVKQRDELLATEVQRQQTTEQINQFTVKRLHREAILKNQQGPVDDLIDERSKLEQQHADRTQELVEIQNLIRQANSAIDSAQNQIDSSQLTLKTIREEYENADSENCSLCGQAWPADKPKPGLSDIEARGNRTKEAVDNCKARKAELQAELNKLLAAEKAKVEELKAAEAEKNNSIAEINEEIKSRPKVDPELDEEWKSYTVEIEKLQAELGEPASKQLEAIEAEKGLAETLLQQMNEALAQADNIEKSKARIKELEARQRELAQLIADVAKKLDRFDDYEAVKNNMIEAAVNAMFEHVEFQLFDHYLNEGYKPCCICRLNGKPYNDLSGGEKMFADLDVRNTLMDYYGVDVPFFFDNAESFSLGYETESQAIELIVDKRNTELQIEVEQSQEAGKAVA